jgi:hypothetical protein
MEQEIFIKSKKFTGVGASGLNFDFKLPADADRITGVLATYAAPNATVAAAGVYAANFRFAHGRLLVNSEKNLNVPFVISTFGIPDNKQEFIPCSMEITPNSYVSGYIRLFNHATPATPEGEDCTLFIHLRIIRKPKP